MNNHSRNQRGSRAPRAEGRSCVLLALAVGAAWAPQSLLGGAAWAQGFNGRGAPAGSLPSGMAEGPSVVPSTGNGPIKVRDKYLLGPQDIIRVTVERFPNYSTGNLIVPPDGRISLDYFGEMNVIGKTARQLEAELTNKINKRVRNPKVSVTIQGLRTAVEGYVNVIGAVQAQGAVEILAGYRLTEVLAKVGGVRGRYDEVEATLSRVGKPPLSVDLYQAISYPQSKANIPVKADDVLTVQSVDPGQVLISGDVAVPGVYELHRVPQAGARELPLNARISDVVVAVGGFNNADKLLNGRVVGFVQRGTQKIDLRVEDAITFKDSGANIQLQRGDFVNFTIEQPLSINMVGLVRNPGTIRIRPGAGVLEALTATGGLARDPSQTVAVLQRAGTSRPIDLNKLLAGDISENLVLQTGDTLNLTSPDTMTVFISGAVVDPSKGDGLNLPPNATLNSALTKAGGLKSTPDKVTITVVRTIENGETKFLTIDPVALIDRGDRGQDMKLQSGDIINIVEKRVRQATISGEIVRPGPYNVDDDGVDLATFIAGAGGPKDTALLSQVTIKNTLDNSTKVVDAYDAVINGRSLNVNVREGDLIVIPRNFGRILVSGSVRSPGAVPLPEKRPLTVLDAVTAAGGTLPGSRTQEIVLVRGVSDGKGGVTPTPRKLALDNAKNIGKGNLADASLPLQDGDIIVVPEGKPRRDPVGTGLQLFSIFSLARNFF